MPKTKVQFVLTEKRLIDQIERKVGCVLLEGEVPEGVTPEKVLNAIMQGKTVMYTKPLPSPKENKDEEKTENTPLNQEKPTEKTKVKIKGRK